MTGTAAYAATHYSYYLQAGMATVIVVVIPNLWSKNMNREDIIRMAREAGGGLSCIAEPLEHPWKFSESELMRFASLVAAAEREACAKVAWDYGWKRVDNEDVQAAAVEISEAIQARGK